ncbi:MAG: hypothetical protein RL726_1830, partial [Actinomycetota bacterium]
MNKFVVAGVMLLVACGSPSYQSDTVSDNGPVTGPSSSAS